MSKEEIPRYLSISDAVVPSDGYVEVRDGKTEELESIYYPVFLASDTLNIIAKIVVKDSKVTDYDMESGNYFSSSSYSIGGRYDGGSVDAETQAILADLGVSLSDELILIKKNDDPLSLNASITLAVIGTLLLILLVASFYPSKTRRRSKKRSECLIGFMDEFIFISLSL